MTDGIGQFEFFGDELQVGLQQRYYRLWRYLKVNSRLSFVGRAIGLDAPDLDDITPLAGLAKELGFLSLAFTKPEIVDALRVAPETEGLQIGLWHHLLSGEGSEEKCRSVMEAYQLPAGYNIERVGPATPGGMLRQFQELMDRCGVAPLPGYILRGLDLPAIAEMVLTPRGQVAAVGAAVFRHSPAGPYGKAAHVGFLATDPDERGRGLARHLLARITLACFQELDAEFVHTGVRTENVASLRVCQACGLGDSGTYFVAAVYPPVLKREQFTR